jgi:Ca-activated chloride channel homolog
LNYLASHNSAQRRSQGYGRLKLKPHEPETGSAPRKFHLIYVTLMAAFLWAQAADVFAQSGRRTTQPATSPASAQRPRRATAQEKGSTANQPASSSKSTAKQVSILPDDAPPAPAPKPKVVQQAATRDVDEEVGAEDVVRITSNLVTVPASVVDTSGRALAGLKVEDFELRVDGQVKAISDISYSDTPVRLALLFDNSSSVTTAREFEKQAAVRFFRTVLRPFDQAAVYNVYTEVTLAHPLTSDVRALVRTIENFGKPEGATRLFDAIVQAANYLRPQPGRKVIVIVSDGEDTLSDMDFEETLRIAQASDCQIYAVQTKQIEYILQTGQAGGNANLRSLAAERRLQELAGQTGGAVYAPLAVSELDAAFAQISADLAQQYVLSYYPVDERQDGRFRAISLRVLSHPNARVRTRKGYIASRAAMKSSINWQTSSTEGTTVAGINASDTVPKDTDQTRSAAPSLISNTASVAPAPEFKVISSGVAATRSQAEPPPPVEAAPPLEATSQPPSQTAQPDSRRQPAPASTPNATEPSSTQRLQASAAPPVAPKGVSGGVLNGKALSLPKPDYPATARAARATGTVIVEVTVDETGKVIAARASNGHPLLKAAAVAAARQARFAPTKLSGQPVQVTGVINYNFALAP